MSKRINLGSLKESVSKALRFVLMHWELFTRVDIAKVVLPEGRESCWEVLFCPELRNPSAVRNTVRLKSIKLNMCVHNNVFLDGLRYVD